MKKWIIALLGLLIAAPALAAPTIHGDAGPPNQIGFEITVDFPISDTTDSRAIELRGSCTIRATIAGSDVLQAWQVTTTSMAASAGTQIGSNFATSTTTRTEFNPGSFWIKVRSTTAVTGGSQMKINCSNIAGGGSGSAPVDADGNGLYEVAYLWDADGDGSAYVPCTADATPDIACKYSGEIVYRDVVDDINCAVHSTCGHGQMERDGILILPIGVFDGFPCWNASSPGANTPAQAEIDDSGHDLSASTANCPVDEDGAILMSVALQGWGGTLLGSGTDSRRLHRGLMDATHKRDKATYFTNDYGPVHLSTDDNRWFGATTNIQMINAGFHSNYTNTAHFTGASLASGDSKGWWKVYVAADLELWGSENSLCLRNTGGTVGTDYAASGTLGNLRRGDIVVIPTKSNANASAVGSYSEVRVRSTPVTACGASNQGLLVPLGGDLVNSATEAASSNRKVYPAYASSITTSERVGHARSNYSDTNVTISNMNLEAQDPYNEIGGRCGTSGSYTAPTTTAEPGTIFTTAVDDTNTDFSCDSDQFVGFWGSGHIKLSGVIINNFSFFPIDGGSSGGSQVLEDVAFMHGNGGALADVSGSGWEFFRTSIDDSTFNTVAFSAFLSGFKVDGLTVRNSSFSTLASFDAQAEGTYWNDIHIESSTFDTAFDFQCDARRHTIRNVYITGRGYTPHGGVPGGIHLGCSVTGTPIRDNLVDGLTIDAPDVTSSVESVPLLVYQATAGNEAAILGNTFTNFHALGYSGGTTDEAACLFGAYTGDGDTSDATHGHSVVFRYNSHTNSSVASNGSVFCDMNSSNNVFQTRSELDTTTPSWGDPTGCGNFDGSVLIPYERCDGAVLGSGTLAVNFASMATTACSAAITTTLTGVATTDSVLWGFVGDVSATTGYTGTDSVTVRAYPTANTVNFKACNPTLLTVDPTQINIWWKAVRR